MPASTVAQYLAALPADRRAALSAVRKAINENLPDATACSVRFEICSFSAASLCERLCLCRQVRSSSLRLNTTVLERERRT